MSTYVFTCGDINGIGPEIVVKTINKKLPSKNRKIIFICPKNVFENTTRIITPLFSYKLCKKLPVKIDTNSVYKKLGYAALLKKFGNRLKLFDLNNG